MEPDQITSDRLPIERNALRAIVEANATYLHDGGRDVTDLVEVILFKQVTVAWKETAVLEVVTLVSTKTIRYVATCTRKGSKSDN